VDRSASPKLTEPILNQPRTVTVVPKEVLEDKSATSVRELARQLPGVTLGFAEGRERVRRPHLHPRLRRARRHLRRRHARPRQHLARDLAVEQIEVLKGPSATINGRGVTGGALNIITKKPNEEHNFYNFSTMFGTDKTVRTTADVNQVLTPGWALRANVLYHNSHVAERDDHVQDERWGGFISTVIKPTDAFKFTIDYYRYRTDGIPDWGVPMDPRTKLPVTETAGVGRSTWYGLANPGRDFMKNDADIVTGTLEFKPTEYFKFTSKTRSGQTTINYLASSTEEATILANPNPATWTTTVHNPNRIQRTEMLGNQSDVTLKF
jgi:catecholate siderophore receptor